MLWNMLLRSDLPNDILVDLHFAVFGLGDSSYGKVCWPAKNYRADLLAWARRKYTIEEGEMIGSIISGWCSHVQLRVGGLFTDHILGSAGI